MGAQESRSGNSHILFDDEIIAQVADQFFDRTADSHAHTAIGRGEAIFFSTDEGDFVLRHYRRGGLPARLLGDRYIGVSLAESRAWREWRLLDALYRSGLPVPQPVAARVVKSGLFYRADLVTRRLPAEPLADLLLRGPLDLERWQQLGRTLAIFHDRGVLHADLNARNIMVGEDGAFYLIDFDRGEIRDGGGGWRRSNLNRLHRSLEKFRLNNDHFSFTEDGWQALLRGYQGG